MTNIVIGEKDYWGKNVVQEVRARMLSFLFEVMGMEMEATGIADDAGIGELASWNSLARMRLIMAMEAHMGTSLSPGNVVAIGSLQEIATVLEGGELSVTGF